MFNSGKPFGSSPFGQTAQQPSFGKPTPFGASNFGQQPAQPGFGRKYRVSISTNGEIKIKNILRKYIFIFGVAFSAFGQQQQQPSTSVFGQPATSAFGPAAPSFGQPATTQSPFGCKCENLQFSFFLPSDEVQIFELNKFCFTFFQ